MVDIAWRAALFSVFLIIVAAHAVLLRRSARRKLRCMGCGRGRLEWADDPTTRYFCFRCDAVRDWKIVWQREKEKADGN